MANRNQPAPRIAVRWLPIEALTPDPKNARVHEAAQRWRQLKGRVSAPSYRFERFKF